LLGCFVFLPISTVAGIVSAVPNGMRDRQSPRLDARRYHGTILEELYAEQTQSTAVLLQVDKLIDVAFPWSEVRLVRQEINEGMNVRCGQSVAC